MTIGQVGWSGNANWGDDRMLHCLKRYFSQDKIVPFTMWKEDFQKLNACDYILLGGGGLISRGFNYYLEHLQSMKKPFGCIGISIEANTVHQDMTNGVEYLKKHADFIYVRDTNSKKLLGDHYKVFVGPDISFLYPYTPAKTHKVAVGINLRDWPWWDLESFGSIDTLLKNLQTKIPMLKQVYPFKKWEAEKLVEIVKNTFPKLSPLPFYCKKQEVSDVEYLETFFKKVPHTSSIEMFNNVRLVIGMRLHSLIFSTQLGTPFISLSYEPKNEQYCQDIGLPELSLSLKDYADIAEKIAYVRQHTTGIKKQLLDYTDAAQKEAQYLFSRVGKLIHTA